jgi:hypothetical protein
MADLFREGYMARLYEDINMALEIIAGLIIQAGESLSNFVDLTGKDIIRLTMPAGWNSANITFQISSDGNNYNDLFTYEGTEVTMVVTTAATVVIREDSAIKNAAAFLKIRSGTRAFPVPQSQQRDFVLAVSPAP